MRFLEKLTEISRKNDSLLCVGLDTDLKKIPEFLLKEDDPVFIFNKKIVDSTSDLVCAYKPNIAFYESLGTDGLLSLKKTIDYIPDDIPVILDAKRGDIGNTARMYAKAIFEEFKADAVTVNPYLGEDSISPFLAYEDKCSFILCLTSNKSAGDFQLQIIDKRPLYELVAEKVSSWNQKKNCGLVVGATYPEQLKKIREIAYDLPILIPGVGAQKGDLEKTVKFGTDEKGNLAIINSSRGIIYASSEGLSEAEKDKYETLSKEIDKLKESKPHLAYVKLIERQKLVEEQKLEKKFADKAREEAKKLRDLINEFREK